MQEAPAILPMDSHQISVKTTLIDIGLLIMGLGIILVIFGFLRPLARPDSLTSLEIAREMFINHNWVTPTLNNVIQFDMPPLFYWLTALNFKIFGINLFAARLWPALFGIGGAIAFYLYGINIANRRMGWLCAIVFSSGMLSLTLMTAAAPFIIGSVLITISMLCGFLACVTISERRRHALILVFWAACGLNTLLIGLMGILLPLSIIMLYYWIMTYYDMFKPLASVRGIVIYLVIILPWFILAQNHNSDFLHYFFIEKIKMNYLSHFTTPLQTLSFIFLSAFAALIPWTLLANLGFWACRPDSWALRFDRPIGAFILSWITLSFIYLIGVAPTGPQSLFWVGLLTPALSLAIAKALSYYWIEADQNLILESRRLLLVVLVLATSFFCLLSQKTSATLLGFHTTPITGKIVITVFLLFLVGGFAGYFSLKYYKGLKATTLVFACTGIILTLSLVSILPILRQNSFTSMTDYIASQQQTGDVIASYKTYYPEISFRLQTTPLVVVDWQNAPQYGEHYQNIQSWSVSSVFFWRTMENNKKNLFLLVPLSEVSSLLPLLSQHHLEPVMANQELMLFTNKS